MQSTVTHILPLAKIHRSRMLPIPGTVLVRAGQDVVATDLIAEVNLKPEHMLLDISNGLGVPPEKTNEYIMREIGEDVAQDGIVAQWKNGSRVVRAPKAGKAVAISGGKLLLQTENEPYQVLAGMTGTVSEVKADFGAEIETSGAWIQGVWGNDKISMGKLTILASRPDHIFEFEDTDQDQKDFVLFAGYCSNPQVLETCESNQVAGLILGSMATQLIPMALEMSFPIIVIEGFGLLDVNDTAYKLLSTSAGREVSINSMPNNPFNGERPEITIPLESSANPTTPLDMQFLEPGIQVRILRAPYMGKVGIINNLLPGMTRFPSGLRTSGAEIALGNNEKVVVPLANIEVLG